MRLVSCQLESKTPYSQNKMISVPKNPGELDPDYELRVWRYRCNTDTQGNIIIPPMAFANSLKEAAAFLSLPIPGNARATFTKHFEAGVMVFEPMTLPIKRDDVPGEWVFVPSDGKKGKASRGGRVMKQFPFIEKWSGEVIYGIADPVITKDAFEKVLTASGQLIGLGRFRPRNGGYYGTFTVKHIEWE